MPNDHVHGILLLHVWHTDAYGHHISELRREKKEKKRKKKNCVSGPSPISNPSLNPNPSPNPNPILAILDSQNFHQKVQALAIIKSKYLYIR